jgi:hypothetical protein
VLARLGPAFVPYRTAQVHATITGLEGARPAGSTRAVNANFLALRGEERVMDLPRVCALLATSPLLPLTIQVGGFAADGAYPFTSRGRHPHERSFAVHGTDAVAMGWPVAAGSYPDTLARLRRDLEPAGVLHKYHATPDAADNDFFFVLGRVARAGASEAALRAAELDLRALMSCTPVELAVGPAELSVVTYTDPSLPPESSVAQDLPLVRRGLR